MSEDGLSYYEPTSTTFDGATGSAVKGWFPTGKHAYMDWDQPIKNSPVTPLGGGSAINTDQGSPFLLDPATRHWQPWTLPDGQTPPGFIQVDSRGRIHDVEKTAGGFDYRISADGGRTWRVTHVPYPIAMGDPIQTDFHANAAVGVAAVASRVDNQDWVYKFDITGPKARLIRVFKVGLGNAKAAPGIGQLTAPRFDFETVAILPDGWVAVSYLDATTKWHPPGTGQVSGRLCPVLAIELNSSFPTPATPHGVA